MNAYIKDLNALRIFNEFSMYLFSWKGGGLCLWEHIPYIGNFSRGFNFRWVRDLPEIAKKKTAKNRP